MIFLSITAKTLALALAGHHLWLSVALWIAGAAADVRVLRKHASGAGWSRNLANLALLHASALLIGWTAVGICDYAAMRWKDGIPVFATLVQWLLALTGTTAGANAGIVHLTTMAGPLDFAVSIDFMALKVPVLFLSVCWVWLLWSGTAVVEAVRKLGVTAGILLGVALIRTVLVILLANGLFEFVGYESEELPYRPFMNEAAGIWIYLPLLAAAGILIGRILPPPVLSAVPPPAGPRWHGAVAFGLMFLLAFVIFREPEGKPKQGKVVLSGYHAQWSRSDRPYDREWYGADSGYNYACLKRLFEKFRPVVEAAGPLSTADLDGASMLVIYDPDRRFGKDEIERVHEFVRSGGGLLLIGDHTNVFGSTSHLNELCGPFGIRFRDDVLFDLDEDFHQVIDAPRDASSFWHGMSFFKLRGPASIQPTSLWTRPVYEVGHSKSVRAIYSVNNFYPPPHDGPGMKSGTFCVASASRYGKGRVAAWGDSTVFSNFEIFYPGKYEYLLNTMHWLNHEDSVLPMIGRRMAPLILLAGMAFLLLRRREPRFWLVALTMLATACAGARGLGIFLEQRRAVFPEPASPSEWVVFVADPQDKGHHLRGFITEEPYDQRYEVFIQWVLRTGAFSGFHVLGTERGNGLHDHLRRSDSARTSLALIVRKPDDLAHLEEFGKIRVRPKDPYFLMFASSIPAEQAMEAIKRAGILKDEESLAQVAKAWPSGEVMIQDGGRSVLVVANAERFSDQSMGITEKVVPNEDQRVVFNRAFALIDRLFGREPVKAE